MSSFCIRLWICVSLLCGALWGDQNGAPGRLKVERLAVGQGAELITIFRSEGSTELIPLLGILRDAPNGPETERLRQIWLFSYARPSWHQQLAAALPFFYHRAGAGTGLPDHRPKPLLNLAHPASGTWSGLAGTALQSEVLDPKGIPFRAPTRGYRGNSAEYRDIQVAQALASLELLEADPAFQTALTPDEWEEIVARLMLSRQLLGGLVRESSLPAMVEHKTTAQQIERGHNWELLRQKAEENGLYFESLGFGQATAPYALLWVAREDVEGLAQHRFDGTLLGIRDPWTDPALTSWKGYEEVWSFDGDGNRVREPVQNGRALHMIPLALYALDYPPAPLLLADFRDNWKAKRHEMLSRAVDYTAEGLLGWTGLSNPAYWAARLSWEWFERRRGTNVDRASRLSAYGDLRQALFFDDSLDPDLRNQIARRLDHLAINPFDHDAAVEARIAERQYAALLAYARDPQGLPKDLARERGAELRPLSHGKAVRIALGTASAATFGLYRHSEKMTPEAMALLERTRRLDSDVRFLKRVLKSGPDLELVWSREEINRHIDDIAESQVSSPELRGRSQELSSLVNQLLERTQDEETRRHCAACLAHLKNPPEPLPPGPGAVRTPAALARP